MFFLIIVLVIGINVAPFIFDKMDMWTAQGLWVQMCSVAILSYMFFEKKKYTVSNSSLALMFAWLSYITFYRVYKSYTGGLHEKMQQLFERQEFLTKEVAQYVQLFKVVQNVIYTLAPYLNFFCLLIIYLAITEYLSRVEIKKIMVVMKYTIIFTLLTCVLQKFFLTGNTAAQFFRLLIKQSNFNEFHNNLVTGFLSNGTHLSGFLASCAPLFFWRMKRVDVLSLILMVIILWSCSTTIGDPSISGYVILALSFLFFYKTKKLIIPLIILFWGVICLAGEYLPPQFWSFHGRFDTWQRWWPIFMKLPMTGHGLGTVNILSKDLANSQLHLGVAAMNVTTRHLHLEYFQVMVETGVIGLCFVLNMVHKFFITYAQDRTELALKTMVFGFLLSCLFTYPAHLWLPSSWAMITYASFVALRRENYGVQPQRIKR